MAGPPAHGGASGRPGEGVGAVDGESAGGGERGAKERLWGRAPVGRARRRRSGPTRRRRPGADAVEVGGAAAQGVKRSAVATPARTAAMRTASCTCSALRPA